MNYITNTPVGRFRLVAIVEGLSYIFLLFVAMPLKYWFDSPSFVTYTGWVHGLFFMLYILTLIAAKADQGWKFKRTFLFVLAAFIPFATFVVDRNLHREEKLRLQAQ